MRPSMRVEYSTVLSVCLCFLLTAGASAGTMTGAVVTFSIEGRDVETGELLQGFQQLISVSEDGSFSFTGFSQGNDLWELSELAVGGNVDPVADMAYGLTNVAAFPVAYSLSLNVPVVPQVPSTLIGGSTGGSVADADAMGGATLSNSGSLAFFRGLIDGSPVLTLHDAPFSFSAPSGVESIPPDTAGLPGPTIPAGPATVSIGLQNNFILTPGDSMSASNVFQVERIPEPASALVCIVAVVGVVGMIRFRGQRPVR